MGRRIALLIVGLLTVFGLGACGGDKPAAVTTFSFTGRDFSFDAPKEVAGGLVKITFKNAGTTAHAGLILDIDKTPIADLERDFPVIQKGGPIPSYLKGFGGFAKIPAGETRTSTEVLPAGHYVLFCAVKTVANEAKEPKDTTGRVPHFKLGMVRTLTVTNTKGDATTADLSSDGGAINAVEATPTAYAFNLTGLKTGTHDVAFVNPAGNRQAHGVAVQEFPAGTTLEQATNAVETILNTPAGNELPAGTVQPVELARTPMFSPGTAGTLSLLFKPGRVYAMMCMIQDRAGGALHAAAKGMRSVFTA